MAKSIAVLGLGKFGMSLVRSLNEMGARSAAMLVSESVLDYFELGSRLSMIEMAPLNEWVGKSMVELNIRNKYQMTIVACKDEKGEWMPIDPEQPLQDKMRLLAVVDRKNLGKLRNQ